MAIKQVAGINSPNELFNRYQAEVAKINSALECPLLNGVLVTAALKAAGPVDVNHGLGRAPQGWLLAGVDAQATVWSVTPAAKQKQVLSMFTSADCNVSLWVF